MFHLFLVLISFLQFWSHVTCMGYKVTENEVLNYLTFFGGTVWFTIVLWQNYFVYNPKLPLKMASNLCGCIMILGLKSVMGPRLSWEPYDCGTKTIARTIMTVRPNWQWEPSFSRSRKGVVTQKIWQPNKMYELSSNWLTSHPQHMGLCLGASVLGLRPRASKPWPYLTKPKLKLKEDLKKKFITY